MVAAVHEHMDRNVVGRRDMFLSSDSFVVKMLLVDDVARSGRVNRATKRARLPGYYVKSSSAGEIGDCCSQREETYKLDLNPARGPQPDPPRSNLRVDWTVLLQALSKGEVQQRDWADFRTQWGAMYEGQWVSKRPQLRHSEPGVGRPV